MKTYSTMRNVGKVRHVVSFHSGEKFHKDGSPFSDIRCFSNKREVDKFTRSLESQGYIPK